MREKNVELKSILSALPMYGQEDVAYIARREVAPRMSELSENLEHLPGFWTCEVEPEVHPDTEGKFFLDCQAEKRLTIESSACSYAQIISSAPPGVRGWNHLKSLHSQRQFMGIDWEDREDREG